MSKYFFGLGITGFIFLAFLLDWHLGILVTSAILCAVGFNMWLDE